MIHHVSVGRNDLERARAFCGPLMALIGFRLLKREGSTTLAGNIGGPLTLSNGKGLRRRR